MSSLSGIPAFGAGAGSAAGGAGLAPAANEAGAAAGAGSPTAAVCWAPGHVSDSPDADGPVTNLWPGMAAEKLPALTAEEAVDAGIEAGMQQVLHHIKHVICSGDAALYKWMLGYIACMLKTPGDKRGSPVLIIAGSQGAGKDVFVDCLRLLIGWSLTYPTADWDCVVGDPTMESACKLLVWVQESGLEREEEWATRIKRRIEAKKITFTDTFGGRAVCDDCVRIINTTNNAHTPPSGDLADRHFCVVKVAGTYVGNSVYFNRLLESISSPRVQRKLHDYFTTTDALLDGWDASAFPTAASVVDSQACRAC